MPLQVILEFSLVDRLNLITLALIKLNTTLMATTSLLPTSKPPPTDTGQDNLNSKSTSTQTQHSIPSPLLMTSSLSVNKYSLLLPPSTFPAASRLASPTVPSPTVPPTCHITLSRTSALIVTQILTL